MSAASRGWFFPIGHQLTFGSIQPPFAGFPFALGTLTFSAIEFTERSIFRYILNELISDPLKQFL